MRGNTGYTSLIQRNRTNLIGVLLGLLLNVGLAIEGLAQTASFPLNDHDRAKLHELVADWFDYRIIGEIPGALPPEGGAVEDLIVVNVFVNMAVTDPDDLDGLAALGITDHTFHPMLSGVVSRAQLAEVARDVRVTAVEPVLEVEPTEKFGEAIMAWVLDRECFDPFTGETCGDLIEDVNEFGERRLSVWVHLHHEPTAADVVDFERYGMDLDGPIWSGRLTAAQILDAARDPRVRGFSPSQRIPIPRPPGSFDHWEAAGPLSAGVFRIGHIM